MMVFLLLLLLYYTNGFVNFYLLTYCFVVVYFPAIGVVCAMTVPLKKSLTVALTVSVLSVIAIISTFKKTRSKRVVHSDGDVTDKDYPDDIKNELTSRVQTFFGSNGFKSVENSFVVVISPLLTEPKSTLCSSINFAGCWSWGCGKPLCEHACSLWCS